MKTLTRFLLVLMLSISTVACGTSITGPHNPDSGDYTPDSGNHNPDSGDHNPDSGDHNPDSGDIGG